MPLQKQVFDLPLVAGLEQATREESRELAAGFTTLENTVQAKRGAWSKRPGHVIVGLTGAGAGTALLASHRDEGLIHHDGTQIYSYSLTADRWSARGECPSLSTERFMLASPGIFRGSVVYDVVQCGGYLVMIYEGARALYAVVLDADTKAPVLGPERLAVGLSGVDASQEFRASLVVCGDYVACVYNRENLTAGTREDAIFGRVLDVTDFNAGWAAAVNITGAGVIDLTVGNFLFDLSPSTAGVFHMIYMNLAVGQTVVRVSCPALAVLTTAAVLVGIPGVPAAFSVDGGDGDTLWLAQAQFAAGGAVAIEARNPTTLAVTGVMLLAAFPSQIIGGETGAAVSCAMVRTANAAAKVLVSGANTLAASYDRSWIGWRDIVITAGNVAGSGFASYAANLEHTHKPWLANGHVYAVVVPKDDFDTLPAGAPVEIASATNLQRCMYVVDITSARASDVQPCANLAPRINATNGTLYYPRYTRTVATFSDGRRGIVYPVLRSGVSESFELAELSLATTSSAASLGGVTHMAGGVAFAYDGNKPIETAFVQAPRVKAFTAAAGTLNGTYLYTAVWEHEDAAGSVHYSEPAAPISVTHAGATASVIRITTPTCTYRQDNPEGSDRVRAVLYRTAASGSTYYRCAETNAYNSAGLNGETFVPITDDMADATLTQRARLYTQPGTLGTSFPRRAPPGLRHIVQHGDILAGIADDRRTIWFSAPLVSGEGQWFSDVFIVEVDDASPLVALASFDGRLFAFTRAGVWAIDGQGWTENGTGGMSMPQRIPVDVGCVDARSVCVGPMGALFQSDQGICLLSRGGQVTFFGEAVADTLAAYPTITSAVLNAVESAIVFTCRNGASGVQLVFDYVSNAWTTENIASLSPADSACVAGGVYYRSLAAVVRRRTAGLYIELPTGAGWYGQTIETGWAKFSGLQGFQRLWKVLIRYVRRSAFSLRVSFAYDYAAAYTETRTWTEAEITAMASPALEITPAKQKCRAIRVKIEELAPATVGTGQGLELIGLRFVVGLKERAGYPAAAKR